MSKKNSKFPEAPYYEQAAILEVILRAVGGGVEIRDGAEIGYGGHITVDRPRPNVLRVRTIDLAEGNWNPEHGIQSLLSEEQFKYYVKQLAMRGVRALDVDAAAKEELTKDLRNIVAREINQIIIAAEERQAQEQYLRDIAEEEAEDDREREQATMAAPPIRRPRGTRRG